LLPSIVTVAVACSIMWVLLVWLLGVAVMMVAFEVWRGHRRDSGTGSIPSLAVAAVFSVWAIRIKRWVRVALRALAGRQPVVSAYLDVSDPHSALVAFAIARLSKQCSRAGSFGRRSAAAPLFSVHLVRISGCADAVERDRWSAWARKDAHQVSGELQHLLAGERGSIREQVPCDAALLEAERIIATLLPLDQHSVDIVARVFSALWVDDGDARSDLERIEAIGSELIEKQVHHGQVTLLISDTQQPQLASDAEVAAMLARNGAELQARGHYLSAMLFLDGEWFWGIDRLVHLELRLMELHLLASPAGFKSSLEPLLLPADRTTPPCYAHQFRLALNGGVDRTCIGEPTAAMISSVVDAVPGGLAVELFYSFRSPYSQLVIDRLIAICHHHRVQLLVRPVLPMATRGYTISLAKRMYIMADAKREATILGIPFGRVHDPLGVGVERAMIVFYMLDSPAKQLHFIRSWARYSE
jgi:2-hydroxychromene-2-carboxylate isomerase